MFLSFNEKKVFLGSHADFTQQAKSSNSDDGMGDKLAVTKCHWLCLCYSNLHRNIPLHRYWTHFIYKNGNSCIKNTRVCVIIVGSLCLNSNSQYEELWVYTFNILVLLTIITALNTLICLVLQLYYIYIYLIEHYGHFCLHTFWLILSRYRIDLMLSGSWLINLP